VVRFFVGQRGYFGFHQSEKGESRNEVRSSPAYFSNSKISNEHMPMHSSGERLGFEKTNHVGFPVRIHTW